MTRVLYIGGTGEISQACVEEAVRIGHEVSVFNRGNSASLPKEVELIRGDLSDKNPYAALGNRRFDVICQFLAFDTDAIQRDITAFSGRCQQYVFVSSAAAYQKPCRDHIITEATPLDNSFWEYGRKKAACEGLLLEANANNRLATTIVRPSHTYRTRLPGTILHSDHQAWRILRGDPVIVHGDGQSLWTLTHAEDFARAFTRLCNNPIAFGETYHITNSRAHTWNNIIEAVGEVLGKAPVIRHIASDLLIRYHPDWLGPLLGDKSNSLIFDNTKIAHAVPDWHCTVSLESGLQLAHKFVVERLEAGYQPDQNLNQMINRIIQEHDALPASI